jgi:hypothetical protein
MSGRREERLQHNSKWGRVHSRKKWQQRTGTCKETCMVRRQEMCQVGWLTPAILATQEAEIRRIAVPSQPVQKVSEILISTNKTGVVVHISVVSAIHEAMGRKITVFTSL